MDLKVAIEKTKSFLFRRQSAYRGCFSKDNGFSHIVLKDLADFCRAQDSTFHPDQRVHAVLEGRREVWLRIEKHLKLDQENLWKTYGRKDIE